MVAHVITYLPNVGAFGPSDDLTYPSLWKLQYTNARTNMTNAIIVAHAITCLPNVGAFGPSGPSHLTYPSYGSYSIVFIFAHFLFLHTQPQLNLTLKSNSYSSQPQPHLNLNHNPNSIWLWHKSKPILFQRLLSQPKTITNNLNCM